METNKSILDNIELHKDHMIVSVNPKFYPLSIIYAAAYSMLDKVHVIIDGDPDSEVLVELRPKQKQLDEKELKEIGYAFNDELINYSIYTIQATRTKRIREMLVESALRGNVRGPPPQGIRGAPQISPRFPQPQFGRADRNQSTSAPGAVIDDPLGIRKVKTPEEDEIDDPRGIIRDNTKKDNSGS